ncbi:MULTISPECIES: hypothetical protein [unclassified Flavobacterium]|uniref:hypothetical protein n=1 Tax=unclassified Flavobacterium TaxID=196869 RepID=UPI0013EE1C1F|nr:MULTISPECIES: hypothetical protein [unclassified Flavobacterium]MCD0474470.1 hypothetical protein [Flavobacterium sp. EDS]
MLKTILNLEGAHKLTKNEQKMISAGGAPICETGFCARKVLVEGELEWRCVPC